MNALLLLALFQSPQQLVDAAAPGSVVHLPIGSFPALDVWKPLTIVGSSNPLSITLQQETRLDAITLSGSGGSVKLAWLHVLAPIMGQGFERVTLSGMDVFGELTVPDALYVEVSKSSIGDPFPDPLYIPYWEPDVYAPLATVVLLDCTMTAGLPESARLITANADCARYTGSDVRLDDDLSLAGPMRLGRSFQVAWSSSGPSVLYAATGMRARPVTLPRGMWFLDGTAWPLLVAAGPCTLSMGLPSSTSLLGLEIGMQLYSPGAARRFSRPILGVVQP